MRVATFAVSVLGLAMAASALGGPGCVLFRSDDALTSGSASGDAAVAASDGGGQRDAGDAGDFCATAGADAALCDDFDHEPLSARWAQNLAGASKVTVDEALAVSAPRSLSVSVAPGLPDCSYARIEHALDGVKNRTVLSVELAPLVLADEIDLLTLEIGESGNGACRFLVRWSPGTTALVEQLDVPGGPGRTTVSPAPRGDSSDAFRSVELTVDLDAATVDLAVGGASVLGGPKKLAYTCASKTPAFVAVGAHCRSGGDEATLRFDDVLLTTR